jgi:Ca2+-transporting ATPase
MAISEELQKGLTDEEVTVSRAKYGTNTLDRTGSKNIFHILAGVFKEPMMILLAAACSIYFFTGETGDGIIMLAAIFIVAGISIYQETKSESAIKALKKLTQPLTNVMRNSQKTEISSEEIVVGDIMIIEEGQSISADAKIIESNDLSVDESILTGESFSVEKVPGSDEVYMGTNVASGFGYTEVISVGMNTKIGKLGKTLESIKKEDTVLQKQINNFVRRMAFIGFVAFLFVWAYNYYDSGDIIHGLMHGLTLAMAVLPEEIPVALTTFMALGAYHLLKYNILTKQPQTVEALGSATVICTDKTGTLTENKMKVTEIYNFRDDKIIEYTDKDLQDESNRELINYSKLSSEPEAFDPMETAIEELFEDAGDKNIFNNLSMIKEYPLSGKPPMMTHIYSDGKTIITSCKGAPEGIINISDLADEEKEKIHLVVNKFAEKGLRVLGVAKADFQSRDFPADQRNFKWQFLGLIALSDPPKKNIKEVINDFYRSGIEVKMITGDYPVTAKSIGRQIGLKNPDRVLTGEEIIHMSDKELQDSVQGINIFARMLPEAKLKIVNALKADGEVVAMTGDGVNDGPALKASNIGIAMGKKGSEIAKQEASLILVDDDLSNMVKAVALGRKIYSNLKKAIRYIISIHIPIISIVTFPLILGWKYQNIFMPIHVIFLELVMGPTCSIVFENEPIEKDILDQKPRKLSTKFFSFKELAVSMIQGLVIAFGLMGILYYTIQYGISEEISRTMIFTSLLFSNIFLTYTGRSERYSIFTTLKYSNKLLYIITLITIVILILSLTVKPVIAVFNFDSLTIDQLLISIAVSFISVIWIEVYKASRLHRQTV